MSSLSSFLFLLCSFACEWGEDGTGKVNHCVYRPAPPKETPIVSKLGFLNLKLDKYAQCTRNPFPQYSPPQARNLVLPPTDQTNYTLPTTITNARLAKRTPSPEPEERVVKRQFGGQAISDLFTPISTNAPPTVFTRRSTHPAPRLSIVDTGPLETNKFYSNLYLSSQAAPVFTYPYSVWFSKGNTLSDGTREPFGLSISHVDQNQRSFGPTHQVGTTSTTAIEFYLSPVWIRSLNLGAVEFNPASGTPTMELRSLAPMSVDVTFYVNKAVSTTRRMRTPLCLGMGFISAEYFGITPKIESSIFFRTLTRLQAPFSGIVKYRAVLEDGKIWVIYANPDSTVSQVPFSLTVMTNGRLQAAGPFSGIIQVAKVGSSANSNAELALDRATGGVCNGATVTAQTTGGSVANYQINYQRYKGSRPLLMFALPHHINSFTSTTRAAQQNSYRLTSTAKGMMTAVVSDRWLLTENSLPTNIGWMPVKSGAAPVFSATALTQLSNIARTEIGQDFNTQTNLDQFYFAGKAFGKLAYLCLTARIILSDTQLTRTCLDKLKTAYSTFTSGNSINRLVYEQGWRGVVSDAVYKTGDPAADFGAGYYNDHHFHYSYFVHAAAVIAYLDAPAQGGPGTWLSGNRDWVNTLVRDFANPSTSDTWFPVSRSFDFWHGHSWAKGLFESLDGKDEESSSEDVNAAYAIKMWGYASGQPVMQARGNLMLAILRRSVNTYMLISPRSSPNPTNPDPWGIHPTQFNPNRVSGILFENKVHHTTYFGTEAKHIQGIHMIPLTPTSPYIRSAAFAQDEWNAYFANTINTINDGWRGILYQNVALWSPRTSWSFFAQSTFNNQWLDGGASRAWSLAFAGMLGGAT